MRAGRLKPGWTLHEMIISLGVTAIVVALAVHTAASQLRLVRGVGEIAALRNQLGAVEGISASVLWPVSPEAGDLVVAQDSALELDLTVGSAVVCESSPGRISVPAPSAATGNVLGAYVESPEGDDRVAAYFADSIGGTWLSFHVADLPRTTGICPTMSSVTSTWSIDLREPATIPAGSIVRFLRPLRLSLYRGSDARWYFGAKDWNGALQRFNAIQPVAGPLQPYAAGSSSGLRFDYIDRTGASMVSPDLARIAAVRISTRSVTQRAVRMPGVNTNSLGGYGDSVGVLVILRNAP